MENNQKVPISNLDTNSGEVENEVEKIQELSKKYGWCG
jgi:hypothetical protein